MRPGSQLVSMPDRISITVVVSYRRVFVSAYGVVPFRFRGLHNRNLTDANSRAPGVPVKRWVLAIFPCMRTATRTEKFLRSRCALLTFPPHGMRFGLCIGCDHAAHNTKGNTMSDTKKPAAKVTLLPGIRSDLAERKPEGRLLLRHLRAQLQGRCWQVADLFHLQRERPAASRQSSPIWPTARFTSSGPTTGRRSPTTTPPNQIGAGRSHGCLALFLLHPTQKD